MYGFWSASHNIGEAMTFVVTAFVVGALGWQAGFLSAAGMGLLGVIIIFLLLKPFQVAGEENMTICRYCMAEVSEREIEAEDGCCPECGALLSAGGGYLGDEDGYDDLDELEDDEYGYLDDDEEYDDDAYDDDAFYDDDDDFDFEEDLDEEDEDDF